MNKIRSWTNQIALKIRVYRLFIPLYLHFFRLYILTGLLNWLDGLQKKLRPEPNADGRQRTEWMDEYLYPEEGEENNIFFQIRKGMRIMRLRFRLGCLLIMKKIYGRLTQNNASGYEIQPDKQ